MKILIARMNHETNTFSPVPTPLGAFGVDGPNYDDDAREANDGAQTAMGAFLDLARRANAEIVTPLSAMANPSGPVDAGAYKSMTKRILDAAEGCDAMMLDLHGAMVAESTDDGDGDLLERLRAAHPGVPIAVALDLHGNVTDKMIRNADIVAGFKTYPHVDMYEAGNLAGRTLLARLRGEISTALAWRQLPLMTHTLMSATSATESPAMAGAVQAAKELESHGEAHAVTIMAGFALSDIPAPCLSVLVVGSEQASAQATADRLAQRIWQQRDGFVFSGEPLPEAIARARRLHDGVEAAQSTCHSGNGPVLLLDHSDNCMSGGTCDTMDVLQEALRQGLKNIGIGPLCDPEAVAAMLEAGEGARVTLPFGNKRPLTSLGVVKHPVTLTGKVTHLSDGEYVMSGPTYHGTKFSMGHSALFEFDGNRMIVTERTQEAWDLGVFHCVGMNPIESDYLLLKSRMYCRPVFFPLAKGYVLCDSDGVTSSNYDLFHFKKVRHPVYPLDVNVSF